MPVSALTGEGIDALLARVDRALPAPPVEVELLVPYDRHQVVARLYEEADVLATQPEEDGTRVRARVREDQVAWVAPFVVRRVSRRVRLG